jgi:HSP20 family protein
VKPDNISGNIKDLRRLRKLTQEDLADSLGVSRQTINALETGKYFPSVILAAQIADFFEISFDNFLHEDIISSLGNKDEVSMPKDLSPSPYREVSSIHDAIDRAFDDAFFTSKNAVTLLSVNVSSKGGNLIVEAEIPGVNEEDLDIEVGENAVRISGEKHDHKEIEQEDYYHKEMNYGSFQRVISLPEDVEHEQAEAEVIDGVLRITIPKLVEKKSKSIKLKAKKADKK